MSGLVSPTLVSSESTPFYGLTGAVFFSFLTVAEDRDFPSRLCQFLNLLQTPLGPVRSSYDTRSHAGHAGTQKGREQLYPRRTDLDSLY